MVFRLLTVLAAPVLVFAAAPRPPAWITYNTAPLGSLDRPMLLRTYLPDPDLDPAVFAHHFRGERSPRYNATTGLDVPGEYQPIKGIPAAIALNHGPDLSYVFDSTEGRVLYAWQGGFLDMYPYWGDQQLGSRVSNNYVPRLVGTLFYKAAGPHPVELDGRSVSELGRPEYIGYDLVDRAPTFIVRFGKHTVRTRVQPLPRESGFRLEVTAEPAATITYRQEDPRIRLTTEKTAAGLLRATVTGVPLESFSGYPRRLNFTTASVEAGEQVARNYGCVVCHSTDGSPGHGPTWTGLFDSERPLLDGTKIKADEAYLLESIKDPNAKIAQGFAPNFMPPYVLKDLEYESLVLYLKSLKQPD